MANDAPISVLCNGASRSADSYDQRKIVILDYLESPGEDAKVRIGLPRFVQALYHLPDRALDLLELAAFVYCADRLISRGPKDSLEYHAWARKFHFTVRVRDHEFWSRAGISDCLSEALEFMTGDREYAFSFEPGHSTPKTSLFDDEQFSISNSGDLNVALFSGGLDSLAGVLQDLEDTSGQVCLVSHQSQPGTVRTQHRLAEALGERYPARVSHYKFLCNLKGVRAREESQRSRAFLYTSIAFAVAQAFGQCRFSVYENGITSLNLPRRADLTASRASRTTHPKTIYHLARVFSLVAGSEVRIDLPFLWKTKTDVMALLKASPHPDLIPSSVSCSKTFQNLGQATHCGGCSQCIDRRFAAYASRTDDYDESGIYANDMISSAIPDREIRTTVVDYVRQAKEFSRWNDDHFFAQLLTELSQIVEYLPAGDNEFDRLQRVRELCKRHGDQVALAMTRIRDSHDDLYSEIARDSLLDVFSSRDYLRDPVLLLVGRICELIRSAIGSMFSSNPPMNEADLNAKISALLNSHEVALRREYPVASFAGARTIPDHGDHYSDIYVEAKYLRGATTPSKASEGIAADLTKYPQDKHILFVVYDRERSIPDDAIFRRDFESLGRCTVLIVR